MIVLCKLHVTWETAKHDYLTASGIGVDRCEEL